MFNKKNKKNFGDSVDDLIGKLGDSKLMKENINEYVNNISSSIDECSEMSELELEKINSIRKTIYNINNSRDFLEEDAPSYMWRNSPSMLYLFQNREKFESVKKTIESSILIENNFLKFFGIKLNYIKTSKIIINNFYSNAVRENSINEKDLNEGKRISVSINNLENKLKDIKTKKESLIDLEKTFYERVYGKIKAQF